MHPPQLPKVFWEVSYFGKHTSRIFRYMKWLKRHYNLQFEDYNSLYQWSIEQPAVFWVSIWQFFNVKSHHPHIQTL
jgi:acetoacetyl-CoA synthetase